MVNVRARHSAWNVIVLTSVFFGELDSLVLKFVQNGRTSTFNYTGKGLSISFNDKAKCIPDLGCFSAGEPFFHPVNRPVSLLPQDRDEVAPAFLLYTRRNPLFFQFLKAGDVASVIDSNFLLDTETKVIVPGWADSMKVSTWMQDMKDALLNYRDCNVIIVDWSRSNGIPFALAVANTRIVGAELALLINFLQDSFAVEPESCHIIGHSLGTEIAGYAGERINNLGRITALDPAGPYFRNVSTEVRLDPSDALFVDAIHGDSSDTDPDKPSRLEQTGHIDFYPNGGVNQPGCPTSIVDDFVNKGALDAARNQVVCGHYKVIDYFLATIPNHYGCQPVGVACESWERFRAGKCSDCAPDGSRCAVMGFQADARRDLIKRHPPRKFFLFTGEHPPFCVQQYHVSVKLHDRYIPNVVGEIFITLKGRFGTVGLDVNRRNGMIAPGLVYKSVVTTPEDIDVNSISFRWTCATLKIFDSIQIDMGGKERCKLYLHSVIVTTYTPSSQNPGKQVIICGSQSSIPTDIEVPLQPQSYCARDLY